MFLKELRNLKMGDKEKVKGFNQIFTHLLNKFPIDVQPHDSIKKYYYIVALPTKIFVFVKRVAKDTLALNFVEKLLLRRTCVLLGLLRIVKILRTPKTLVRNLKPLQLKPTRKILLIWKSWLSL